MGYNAERKEEQRGSIWSGCLKSVTGIIRGKTIELSHNPGLPEGGRVEVIVRLAGELQTSGSGLQRCAGALADDWTEEDDRILEEIQRDRELSRDLPE